MVSHEAHERTPVKLLIVSVFLAALTITFLTCVIVKYLDYHTEKESEEIASNVVPELEEYVEEPEKQEINFQPIVDSWVNSVGGSKGIIVYDLDFGKTVGSHNAEIKFQTASLYKLFVVYEGYRRIQNGTWERDSNAGSTGRTIMQCLDLAIRESHSPCAETLWSMIGHEELNSIVKEKFGIASVVASSLYATPTEIMEMMKLFYEHSDITDESLVSIMQDSFLNQPITSYNWRQGLPSGFSEVAKVYNKVGWNWDGNKWTIYDDAAIVEFPEAERNYIIVVMSSGINYSQIKRFGSEFETAFQNALVSTEEL